MFEIVIDLLHTDKPVWKTEPAKQCYMAWKEGSSTMLERVCEAPEYETLADCRADLPDARASFVEYFTPEKLKKERVHRWNVRCRSTSLRIS